MLWVGTYRAKGGEGLYPLQTIKDGLQVGEAEPRIANASYGTWDPRTRTAYFVEEQEEGRIVAWRRSGGRWEDAGACSSGGALPCYLAVHPHRPLLAVANYQDGSVALIELDQRTGRLGETLDLHRPTGRGPDAERQTGPHAHCAVFDETGEALYHVDLGLDRIFRHRLERDRLGEPEVAFEAPPGSGPRHLALRPDGWHALLLCELSAELILLERTVNGFTERHRVKTAPEPALENLGGHLALAGDDALVSNRGHDSIARFALREGTLVAASWRKSGGKSPRFFRPEGDGLLVAHEEGGGMTWLRSLEAAAGAVPEAKAPIAGAAFLINIPD